MTVYDQSDFLGLTVYNQSDNFISDHFNMIIYTLSTATLLFVYTLTTASGYTLQIACHNNILCCARLYYSFSLEVLRSSLC